MYVFMCFIGRDLAAPSQFELRSYGSQWLRQLTTSVMLTTLLLVARKLEIKGSRLPSPTETCMTINPNMWLVDKMPHVASLLFSGVGHNGLPVLISLSQARSKSIQALIWLVEVLSFACCVNDSLSRFLREGAL